MKDLDISLGFNFSRFNSNGWQNLNFDDASKSASVLPRCSPNHTNTQNQRLQNLLSDPPRPAASIYNCLESDP